MEDFLGSLTGLLFILGLFTTPVLVAWFAYRRKKHETDRRTEAVLRALEQADTPAAAELLATLGMPKPTKPLGERLLDRLMWGVLATVAGVLLTVRHWADPGNGALSVAAIACLSVGVAFLTYWFVGKRLLRPRSGDGGGCRETDAKCVDNQ